MIQALIGPATKLLGKFIEDKDTKNKLAHDIATMAEIKRLEHDLRKQRAQRRMATASLVAMATFTAAMFFVDLDRVKALADISNLFYITGGGIVAAYMGASAIMNRNGK